MNRRVSITWTCFHCGKQHRWKWKRRDVNAGPITMECDYCHQDTRTWMDERGRVELAAEETR